MLRMKDQLTAGEHEVAVVRQHYISLARPSLIALATLLVVGGLSTALAKFWLLLFSLPSLLYLGWEVLARHQRVFLISDRRVIFRDGLIKITSFEAPLDKINNIFCEQSLLGRIFDFGDVGIETASEQGTTRFDMVPNPVSFKNQIMHLRDQAQLVEHFGERQNIPRLIADLAALRDRRIISEDEFEAKKKGLLEKI